MPNAAPVPFTKGQPLCFIHLPKTGGCSILAYLHDVLPAADIFRGRTPQAFRQMDDGTLMRYAVFAGHMDFKIWRERPVRPRFVTVVRHPVDRIVSLYYFWRSHPYAHIDAHWGSFPLPKLTKRISLRDFVFHEAMETAAYLCNAQARQLTCAMFEQFPGSNDELLKATLANLETFSVVGTTDRMQDTIQAIAASFHLHAPLGDYRINANAEMARRFPESYCPKPGSVAADVEQRIVELNQIDLAIYRWASRRMGARAGAASCAFDAGGRARGRRSSTNLYSERLYYQRFSGSPTSARYWTWKYPAETSVFRFGVLDGQRVALAAARPERFVNGGGDIPVLCIDDVAMDTQHPDQAQTSSLAVKTVLCLLDEYVVQYGTCAAGMLITGRQRAEILKEMKPGVAVSPVNVIRFPALEPTSTVCEEFDDISGRHLRILNDVWSAMRGSTPPPLMRARDIHYLRRRYMQDPRTLYSIRLVEDDGNRVLGLLVIRVFDGEVRVVDWIAHPDDAPRLLMHAAGYAMGKNLHAHTILPADQVSAWMRQWATVEDCDVRVARFMGDRKSDALRDMSWFLTPGDAY